MNGNLVYFKHFLLRRSNSQTETVCWMYLLHEEVQCLLFRELCRGSCVLILVMLQIPALVSLKKLPSVNFAGVDSLDDVKNHTYNELFVSGGFIVSDEFVLNPDLITQGLDRPDAV